MGQKKPTSARKHQRFTENMEQAAERMRQEKTTSLAGTGGKVEWWGCLLPDFRSYPVTAPRAPESLKDMAELVNACEDEGQRRGMRCMLQTILDRACVPEWIGYQAMPTDGGKICEITWIPPSRPIVVHRFDAEGAEGGAQ